MPRSLLDVWRHRESALAVAAMRIAVVGTLLLTNEPRDAVPFVMARVPWIAPEGLGWFVCHIPASPALFSTIRTVYYAAAALAFIGVYTRAATAILLLAAFGILGLAQLGGAVLHDMHLLWLLGILVGCRSGEALSVDEWFRTRPGDGASQRLLGKGDGTVAFGRALFFARTLLGIVYFFPGFWKLRESGLTWAMSDNLAHQMHAKWFEFGIVPCPRIDRSPNAMHALGLGTISFELSFLALVHIGPRTRFALAGAGLAFHLGIEHFMRIPFWSLLAAYSALLPWSDARGRPCAKATGEKTAMVTVIGVGLVLANAIQGFRGRMQSYPFACYPTFQWLAPASLVDLELTAFFDNGTRRTIPHGRDGSGRRTQREWATVWSVAGVYGPAFSVDRLERYVASERRRAPVQRTLAGAREIRAALVWWTTDPEAWGTPPERSRELGVIPLRAP